MSRPVIGFAGMTHLGICSAAAAMKRGFKTVCFDEDAAVVDALARGRPAVAEPGLHEILRSSGTSASFTTRATDLKACDVVYISADVATDDSGRSDLTVVNALVSKATQAMRAGGTLVVLCQVPPGYTRRVPYPAHQLYYQVETLIFGRAIDRALNPERFIVGCADPSAPLPAAYADALAAFACPVLPMRYESAELSKIAINCCLVASIAAANTLAELCEKIGAVWSEIVPALKLDKRIGQHAYLSPGLGIAGGNLERDLATVMELAQAQQTDAGVVKAWVANSAHRKGWAARTIRAALLDASPRSTIAVWGLAYKENTNSTKNSPSLATIAELGEAALRLHDPVVPAVAAGRSDAYAASDPLDAARGADALLVLTPWPQYRDIAPSAIAQAMRGRIVLDPYGVINARAALAAGLTLYTLGRSVIRAGNNA
jgi:UDPglucose 6-dehydrogenase